MNRLTNLLAAAYIAFHASNNRGDDLIDYDVPPQSCFSQCLRTRWRNPNVAGTNMLALSKSERYDFLEEICDKVCPTRWEEWNSWEVEADDNHKCSFPWLFGCDQGSTPIDDDKDECTFQEWVWFDCYQVEVCRDGNWFDCLELVRPELAVMCLELPLAAMLIAAMTRQSRDKHAVTRQSRTAICPGGYEPLEDAQYDDHAARVRLVRMLEREYRNFCQRNLRNQMMSLD